MYDIIIKQQQMEIGLDKKNCINEQIRASKVLLLGKEGEKIGVFALREALDMADKEDLDLMQVGQNQEFAICKIVNYSSWLYHEQKKKHKQEVKNKSHDLKCINFRPGIGENDFNRNIKKISEFLEEQHKVKVSVKFKSFRETTMVELNNAFIEKIINSLDEFGILDGKINNGGRDINFIVKPSKAKQLSI